MSDSKCTLTLREMDEDLVKSLKKESKELSMSPTKLVSCLFVLYELQCRYTREQLRQAGLHV
ncbi:MAG: hypothetical protein CVU57_16100 [Deltaproteobacteria bacterium HGW-Deltaproteobacteria-15]|jgi:hypothetical protein|nr:MAG: hypothetical protein CVU57_16100 [Deltaproteobacteria bacterium HGW-Deltaproteobacteria-15]